MMNRWNATMIATAMTVSHGQGESNKGKRGNDFDDGARPVRHEAGKVRRTAGRSGSCGSAPA